MRIRIWAAGAAMCLGLLLTASRSQAAEYYVSPSGSDSNPGTIAATLRYVAKGGQRAGAGDTVWLRGGTYKHTKQITLSEERHVGRAAHQVLGLPARAADHRFFGLRDHEYRGGRAGHAGDRKLDALRGSRSPMFGRPSGDPFDLRILAQQRPATTFSSCSTFTTASVPASSSTAARAGT